MVLELSLQILDGFQSKASLSNLEPTNLRKIELRDYRTILKGETTVDYSRLSLLVTVISCLAVLVSPILVTGCAGDEGNDRVVAPDPEPVSQPTPQPEPTPQPAEQQQPEPQPAEQQQPAQPQPAEQQPAQPQPEPPPQPVEQQPEPQPEQPLQPEPEPGVSFQEDISPILQASCAVPGCHAAPNPARGLNLTTYADFEKGNVFNPGDSKGSEVIRRIDGGGMPPAGPLPKDQIQLFKDWIDEGAKNN